MEYTDFEHSGDSNCSTYHSCTALVDMAFTTMQTASTAWFGKTLYCKEGSDTHHCDMVNGWVTTPRVEADNLDLESDYFDQGSYDKSQSASEDDVMEVSVSQTGDDGVCAEGDATDGAYQVTLHTRDGDYVSSRPKCDF